MACSVPAFADDCSGVGEVEGRVIDSANRPVVNVLVSAFPLECALGAPPPAPVKTSAEGTFRLKGVLAGLTAAYASKPENPATKVTVRAGQLTSDIVIGLTKAEIVAGKILDEETSQPLLNVWVRISRIDSEDLGLSLGPDFTGDIRFLLPANRVRILIKSARVRPLAVPRTTI
jgi:hypothetical protein